MKNRLIFLFILFLTALQLQAVPAKRGVFTFTQPDGSEIRIRLAGDEFTRIITTEAGSALTRDSEGYYCYAYYDLSGHKRSSGVRASSDNGSCAQAVAARYIPFGTISNLARHKRRSASEVRRSRTADLAPATRASGNICKGIIILAEFPDLKFRYGSEYFENMLSLQGYSYDGASGSARDYFNDQFQGVSEFEFDICPVIVTLSKAYAIYGKNDEDGDDSLPAAKGVAEACRLADPYVNFADYDMDGDGQVDNVFVFVAGGDEAQGAGEDHIWSHQWSLEGAEIRLALDGKLINSYAISSELDRDLATGKYSFTSIGTFCHEFSHCLGLPDLYDTDYEESGGQSYAVWGTTSIMDYGNYNNDGRTPPNYNAFELSVLGLGKELKLTPGPYRLKPLSEEKRYALVETDCGNDFYLLEVRDNSGWDAYVGGSGMLIYHVDLTNDEVWWNNSLNCNPSHQYVDLVEAIPIAKRSFNVLPESMLSMVFWPNGIHTSFTPNTEPALKSWKGGSGEISITDITKSGKNVSFTATGTLAFESIEAFQDAAIVLWSCTGSENCGIRIESPSGETEDHYVRSYSQGCFSYSFKSLEPSTNYKVTIFTAASDESSVSSEFTTKAYFNEGYPFIYLNSSQRNSDGSFIKGGRMPLVVFNAPDARNVSWTFDDGSLSTDGSGYYTVHSSCTLRAIIDYADGSRDVISKQITVR